MSEDEFDFAGQNPATLLPIDKKATSFDYVSQLQQQGYTPKKGPPDLGGLFKTLASEYIPTRIVHLPPKVVTRIHIGEVLRELLQGFIVVMFVLICYLLIVVFLGILMPYYNISSFEEKIHFQPGAICTITDMYVESDEESSDDGTYYTYLPVLDFTLSTPDGKNYQAHEYQPGSYDQQAQAQQRLSQFQVGNAYLCWYNSLDSTEASFSAVQVDFWDYFWFVVSPVLFLVFAVLPNVPILRALCRFISDLVHGRTELVW